MGERIDILSPAILAGFVAFCLTLQPAWFLGVSAATLAVLFGLLLVVSSRGRDPRSVVETTEGFPAE